MHSSCLHDEEKKKGVSSSSDVENPTRARTILLVDVQVILVLNQMVAGWETGIHANVCHSGLTVLQAVNCGHPLIAV